MNHCRYNNANVKLMQTEMGKNLNKHEIFSTALMWREAYKKNTAPHWAALF